MHAIPDGERRLGGRPGLGNARCIDQQIRLPLVQHEPRRGCLDGVFFAHVAGQGRDTGAARRLSGARCDPQPQTFAPSPSRRTAVARPIPDARPAIGATRPV
jgi:hypothetical protein